MSRDNTIELKLIINGKEAVAQVNLTDDAVKKLGANLRAVCNDAELTGNSLVDGFTRARNTIQGMREAWDITRQVFGKPLNLAVQYDQYEAAMEVMLKSADDAKVRMKELEAFAAATPFQLAEVVELGMRLQSIQQYSMDTIKSLGDLAAASGKNMDQVFNAYAKLATGQLGEAKRMFQDVLISEQDWTKALNQKGLAETADNMMAVLNDILVEKGMAGMMDKMSGRMVGKLSNFEDAVAKMQRSLGDGIATGITPFVETMTKGITALNEFSPALSGVIYGMGTLTVSASFLNQTGLLPMIINKEKLIAALQTSRLQFHLASMSGQTFAGSMTAAGVATKGFFASLGPVGWAVLGISALTTAVGALSAASENAKRMQDEFALSLSQMNIDDLNKQLTSLNEQINAEKQARMAIHAELRENYFLVDQIKAVETAISKELERQENLRKSQIGNLRKQLDVELEKSDKNRQLKALEQKYEERKLVAKEGQLLLDVEEWYKYEKAKIEGDAYKKSLKEQEQYLDKLNSLRLLGMQDGLDKELKALDYWYEEQKRTIKKNDFEILDLAKKAKEKQLRLKYSVQNTPETIGVDQQKIIEFEKKLQADRNQAIQQAETTALAIIQSSNDQEFALRRNHAKATISDKQQLEAALAAIDKQELERKKQLLTDQLSEIKTNTTLEKDERELKEQELLTAITTIEGQILDVKREASDRAIDLAEREAEFRKQTMKQIIGDTGNLFGQLYSREQESARREIESERKKRTEALETERRKRLEHAVTNQEKDRINREYDARLKQMEEQYEQRQKEAGVEMFYMQQHIAAVQALINTYEAATKAYAQGGAIFGPPLAAMITALGLAQVAMIESQEPPGYIQGGLVEGSPGIDSNVIRVTNGEYVINPDATSRYINVLDAINNNRELKIPVSADRDSELTTEIRLLRQENRRLLSQQLKAFSRPHKIKAGIDRYETAAIVETAETLINRSKA